MRARLAWLPLCLATLYGCHREVCEQLRPRHDIRADLVAELVDTAQRVDLPADQRVAAIDQLGALQAREAVVPLTEMLPGDWDLVTYHVVRTLGRLGDERALPRLREIYRARVRAPGAIRAAIHDAINTIEAH